jgi:hypothetical protein
MVHQSAWVRFTCSTDRSARVATFRKSGAQWQLAAVSEQAEAPGGAGSLDVAGPFGIAPEYRGCPGCGNDSFVRCGGCGGLGCWRSAKAYFSCGVCGNEGEVSGSIESISALDTG